MTVRPRIDAERVLERAQTDPAYEAALRDAYRGRHDVLDALWWAAHPLTDSARGLPDPAVEHRVLQRAAFARASDPAQANENLQRLQQAEHQLIDDAQSLADAIEAADRSSDPEPDEPDDVELDTAPGPRRKLLLPVVAGVALLAAIVLLPTVVQLGAEDAPVPTGSTRTAERVQTQIVTLSSTGNVTDPIAILNRAQTETDLPPENLGFGDNRETFRRLPDLAPHVQLYLTRDTSPFDVCLTVVRQDRSAISGCTTAENFADTGVNVGGGNRYDLNNDVTILTERFTLLPDGEFQFDATARVTGDAVFPGLGQEVEPDLD